MIITIDGPSASGKSSVSKGLAQKLGYYYLNSGMLYRVLGYVLVHSMKVALDQLPTIDPKEIESCIPKIEYSYDPQEGQLKILVDGIDVISELKMAKNDKAASLLGSNGYARSVLSDFQHRIAHMHSDIIVEGRDAGSVVFPNADIKIYLTAEPQERARRFQKDQQVRGNAMSIDEALALITERDKRDSERAIAPLKVPEGAVIFDTTNLPSKEKSIDELVRIVRDFTN